MVAVIASKYRTLDGLVQMTLGTLAAVICTRRRHRNNEQRRKEQIFLTGVGIFRMTRYVTELAHLRAATRFAQR